jgi:hypothetical protein
MNDSALDGANLVKVNDILISLTLNSLLRYGCIKRTAQPVRF